MYKPMVVPLLQDHSPSVAIAVVEVLGLLMAEDNEIEHLLKPPLADHRYCPGYRTTISKFVSSYFGE